MGTTLFALAAKTFAQSPQAAARVWPAERVAQCWRTLVDAGLLPPRALSSASAVIAAVSAACGGSALQSLDLSPPSYAAQGSPPSLRSAVAPRDRGLVPLAGLRVAGALAGLVRLSLAGCRGVDSAALHALAPLGPSLAVLDLAGCARVNDAGAKALPALLPRLERLVCAGTSVTDSGAAHLARLGALREVDLAATQVTDAAGRALAGGASRERLLFVGLASTFVAGACLPDLAQLCTALRSVDLRGCSRLPAAVFAAFKTQLLRSSEDVVSVRVVSPMKLGAFLLLVLS